MDKRVTNINFQMGDLNMLQNPAHESALPVGFDIKEEEIDLGEDVIILSDDDDSERFLCEECGFIASSHSILLRHVTHHNISEPKMFTCGECSFKTSYKGDLNLHMSVTHAPEEKPIIKRAKEVKQFTEIETSWLKCDQCTYQTLWRTNYDRHYYTHHQSKKIKRLYCGGRCPFSAENKDELIMHISNEHTFKWCRYCQRVTCECDNKEQLKRCRNCKMITCQCGLLAARSQRQHMLYEKCNCKVGTIFKCSQCDSYKETCKQKVLQHMRWFHKSEIKQLLKKTFVRYKCKMCCFKANSQKEVALHIRKYHNTKQLAVI